ncbi:MAG: hypothetical protein H6Q73_1929 [Firmicutes bacterium]|nr:hypothetical protein [Bacillota bacterium]
MEKVCPVCNGMEEASFCCPMCGGPLKDGGVLEDYFGPYSPYMDIDSFAEKSDAKCVHLFYCPNCNYDTWVAWNLTVV